MIRNYALTFSAVLLRVFLGIGVAAVPRYPSLDFDQVYATSVWAAILVSYLAAEWFVVQRTFDGPLSRAERSSRRAAASAQDV